MIRTFVCALVSFISFSILYGQASDSSLFIPPKKYYYQRAYIGISYGLSYPMGSFSASNTEFDNSAFAQAGTNLHYLDFGYRIGKTLGASLFLFTKNHAINFDKLRRSRTAQTGLNYRQVSGGDYELRGAMLGLQVSKANDVIDLDLRFLVGNAGFYLPRLNLQYRDPNSSEIINQSLSATVEKGYGVGVGAGLRIHLNHYLDFMANGTYILFQQTFNQVLEDQNQKVNIKSKINYEVVNLNIGVAFRFINDTDARNE